MVGSGNGLSPARPTIAGTDIGVLSTEEQISVKFKSKYSAFFQEYEVECVSFA